MFDSTKRSNIAASPDISDAIWTRAQKTYNSVKTEHSHRTIAYLPDEIIRIIQSDPALITKAVTTFYERDAIQLKASYCRHKLMDSTNPVSEMQACQYMRRFRPSPAHYATVRMSRSLYAQLASQRFYAPKPFERAGWLSISANDDLRSLQNVENRRRDIGMKIACGFEMLYQEEKSSLGRQKPTNGTKLEFDRNGKNNLSPSTATAGPRHLSQNQAYLRYMVALTESGYFQGETAGSSLYNRLEARAKAYWLDMQEDKAHKGGNLAERMDEIAEGAEKQALPQPQNLQEDPDDWLYIDESRLEDMLQGKPDKAPEGSADAAETMTQGEQEEEIAKEQAKRLQGMADKFSSFLEGQGALEGAMFEDEEWSDDEGEDSDQSDGDDMVAGPSTTTKDKEARLAKLVPGLTDSEWGSAAANEARLVAKRQEDAKKASEDLKSDQAEALQADTKTKGPTKADMQAAGLSAKEKFDGDDSDDELYEEELVGEQEESAAKPKLLQETSMQELSDEEDAELEFGDGEREDFLKFAREALGLTEEQYADILRSREKRGAYIPSTTKTDDDGLELPHKKRSQTQSEIASSTSRAEQNAPSSASISSQTQQQPNSRLDSFEALMQAMDTELSKARQASQRKASERPAAGQTGTGEDDDNMSEDDEDFDFADLDAELAAALKRDESDSAPADYTLIKNFLESFKSQNGLAGPVSNMFGRLDQDFSMPRDK